MTQIDRRRFLRGALSLVGGLALADLPLRAGSRRGKRRFVVGT